MENRVEIDKIVLHFWEFITILTNVMLTELDKELTKRRLKFIRYGDSYIFLQTYGEITVDVPKDREIETVKKSL